MEDGAGQISTPGGTDLYEAGSIDEETLSTTGMAWNRGTDTGGHFGGIQSVPLLCVPVLHGKRPMGDHRHTLASEFVDSPQCRIDRDLHSRIDMGIELIVVATVFTLIVLLTGGPGNTL